MSETLRYEVMDGAARITLDREAKRNALSPEMVSAMLDSLELAEKDRDVRAVSVTGKGDAVFCAGADLAGSVGRGSSDPLAGPRAYAALLKKMAAFGKPTVGRINGHCLAGGLGLMLACDIVIARDDVFFQTPEVKVGIWPMMVGALLYRNVGRKKALDMVLTARRVWAQEAEQIGLITRAVPPDRLDSEVGLILDRLKAGSPVGIRIGKRAFHAMDDMTFEEAVDYLCRELGNVVSTEDAAEGMTAFLQKRAPRFTGK